MLLQRGDVLPQREHAHGELALLVRRLRRLYRLKLRPRRLRLGLCPLLSRLGRLQLLLQERRLRGDPLQLGSAVGAGGRFRLRALVGSAALALPHLVVIRGGGGEGRGGGGGGGGG